jgi:cysteinyl-tRNA synthetase
MTISQIRFYDTARRKKVDLIPRTPGRVGIYVCGPTVYDQCHIGHARSVIAFDIVVRYLRHVGLDVTYVRNITDIDDKIINRANELGEEPLGLSARFTEAFHRDMDALGNLRPDVEPKVSEHLDEILQMIERLVSTSHAYPVDGDVYFAVEKFARYGELSARNLEELQAGARVEVDERKRSPLDFALWKAAKPGEPAWDSPWGPGRPGWHIECSAMSRRYLGDVFDLHGGGMDLIFPHHENEIAQSRACCGEHAFAQHWLHNGFVNIRTSAGEDEKMSKSLGNFFTIHEVCERHEAEALRFFLLGTHYRKPVNFEIDRVGDEVRFPGLEEAERRLAYSYRTVARLRDALSVGKPAADEGEVIAPVDSYAERFHAAMRDDFNTAAALGYFSELLPLANKLLDQPKSAPKATRRRTLQRIAQASEEVVAVLGLLAEAPEAFLQRRRDKLCQLRGIDPALVAQRLTERADARASKDFARADAIRDELTQLGVEAMDRPDGTTSWTVRESE